MLYNIWHRNDVTKNIFGRFFVLFWLILQNGFYLITHKTNKPVDGCTQFRRSPARILYYISVADIISQAFWKCFFFHTSENVCKSFLHYLKSSLYCIREQGGKINKILFPFRFLRRYTRAIIVAYYASFSGKDNIQF